MPRKIHHEVLVFRKTVWLSTFFDTERDTQRWRIYRRPKRTWGTGNWYEGLHLLRDLHGHLKNDLVPQPMLRAYAFTEWSWDDPQQPNGTDLWVETSSPNEYVIWYSPNNWADFLQTAREDWVCMGAGFWEPY